MRNVFLRSLLITPVLFLIAFAQGAVSPAWGVCGVPGADCGDGVGPCSCSDRVVVDTTLEASDPVLRTPCPGDGLFVKSGVTLQISGTIQSAAGQPSDCSGIVVEPGATDVVVMIGTIAGFTFGVEAGEAGDGVTGSLFSRLKVLDSRFVCISVFGDDNDIERNVTNGCGQGDGGIRVEGDFNEVRLNRVGNGLDEGIVVRGDNNTVSRNISQRNALNGLLLHGNNNTVELSGLNYNDQFGIMASGAGNTFARNRCTGNLLGLSNPPGLCR